MPPFHHRDCRNEHHTGRVLFQVIPESLVLAVNSKRSLRLNTTRAVEKSVVHQIDFFNALWAFDFTSR